MFSSSPWKRMYPVPVPVPACRDWEPDLTIFSRWSFTFFSNFSNGKMATITHIEVGFRLRWFFKVKILLVFL